LLKVKHFSPLRLSAAYSTTFAEHISHQQQTTDHITMKQELLWCVWLPVRE